MQKFSSLSPKIIYVFRINDDSHRGCLKVGQTIFKTLSNTNLQPCSSCLNQAAKRRIDQYTQTAGIEYELLYTECTLYTKDGEIGSFEDKDVHSVLIRSGIKKHLFNKKARADEWFETDLETVKRAIAAVKAGRGALGEKEISEGKNPIVLRPEQREAIEQTKAIFRKGRQMLWNAKMRFGKTLSALQLVKELKYKRTLILTHRPVVNAGWYEDFNKIFYDTSGVAYGSRDKGETFETLEKRLGDPSEHDLNAYIYFASLQDLRGSEVVGGNFEKNDALFQTNWDLIIIDEAHEGTQTKLGNSVIGELTKGNTKLLRLSGTPFNLFDSHEAEEVYTWDYIMEQRAKREWDKVHMGDPNPYADLPRLNIFTYDLGELFADYKDEEIAFNFREFFSVRPDGSFKHENDVQSFLNLLCSPNEENSYPYSTQEYRETFLHTLWVLPGVKEAKALSKLLRSHSVFQHFKVVNVAGEGDEEEEEKDALKAVKEAIGSHPEETHTITLSCGRLTTGVSVKEWTAVFMLAGSVNTSVASYMQTIFRVQTPANIQGRTKTDCYVFDFAPDRTLKIVTEAAKSSNDRSKDKRSDKKLIGELLNYCPIISIKGSRMKVFDVPSMLETLKQVYVERAVRNGFEDNCIYSKALLTLTEGELLDFQNLKRIIGSTKALPRTKQIDINTTGLTEEEHEQLEESEKKEKKKTISLTPEQEARKKELEKIKKTREAAISILRSISIRMPLMIYGAELEDEDKGIDLNNFTDNIDPRSWDEFMPRGVTKEMFSKFIKFYDPDIFRASCKRIRRQARSADALNIEERIERITQIFSTFRNPDKETVLTPWRVVNMHLGNCLGGYNFYDEEFKESLMQPRFVSHGKVTKEVWMNPDARILEINAKTGLYSLYATYSLYRYRKQNTQGSPSLSDQDLWRKTLHENIFIICRTKMAKNIVKRTLRGFTDVHVNVRSFDDLLMQITDKINQFTKKVANPKTYGNTVLKETMKFDAIVGNPPYQINDGSGAADDSALPVYHKFVGVAKAICPCYISMIMPSRWMVGGRGLKAFRQEMCSDHRLIKFYDYEDSSECFPNQHIDGGICYFLWGSQSKDKVKYVYKTVSGHVFETLRYLDDKGGFVIRDVRRISLINRVRSSQMFSDIVSSTKPYGIRNYLFNSPDRYPGSGFSSTPFKGSIAIWGVFGIKGGARRARFYIRPETATKNVDTIDKYKLFFSATFSTNAIEPPEIIKADPNVICTETFLLVGPFDTAEEQQNCFNFMHTKFFRALLLFGKGTIHVTKSVFNYIPLVDFSRNWSDKELYDFFELSTDEIELIESLNA